MTLQQSIRILLADDDAAIIRVTAELLSGFQVVDGVGDGQALVDATLRLEPDIIITDITMPVLNGIQAAKKLRDAGCRSRIIFLTIYSDPDIVSECLKAGALGYVEKKRLRADLIPAIHEALTERIFVSPSITQIDAPVADKMARRELA